MSLRVTLKKPVASPFHMEHAKPDVGCIVGMHDTKDLHKDLSSFYTCICPAARRPASIRHVIRPCCSSTARRQSIMLDDGRTVRKAYGEDAGAETQLVRYMS